MPRLKIVGIVAAVVLAAAVFAAMAFAHPQGVSADEDEPTAAPEGQASSFIRFTFPGISAITGHEGVQAVQHPGGELVNEVDAHAGQTLPPVQLPYRDGLYSMSYTVGDLPALEVAMTLSRTGSGIAHQRLSSWGDPALLAFPPKQDGVVADIGSVRGKITAKASLNATTDFADCQVLIGLDHLDGDGLISENERVVRQMSGSVDLVESPLFGSIPISASYAVSVECEGTEVAYHRGGYKWVEGESLSVDKYRDPSAVQELIVTWHRRLIVAHIVVPNDTISPQQAETALVEAEEEVVTWDGTGAGGDGDSPPPPIPGQPGNFQGWTSLNNILSMAWLPISIVIAIVALAAIALRLASILNNQPQTQR